MTAMTRKIIDPDKITIGQLQTLRSEAVAAGDTDLVATINRALYWQHHCLAKAALVTCAKVMQAAIDADDGEARQ